ncbi:hypothetical protein EB796_006327 [Bugula neritina]|uniref:Uncharacterized protein n=1 Tax=Bugula neritina TaxID=10212 RepID=A0A7J7KBY6_BUGNE|nr:hypothetical protein EB796_006327 [Bugula neritina]
MTAIVFKKLSKLIYNRPTKHESQLSVYSSKKVNQKIIMKVLFLVAAIAVCLMTFAPAAEAGHPYGRRCCTYKYKRVCSNRGYKLHCRRVTAGCLRYCPYPFKGYY